MMNVHASHALLPCHSLNYEPLSTHKQNVITMTFRWLADGGLRINVRWDACVYGLLTFKC